jgi:hypothetical protein
MAIKTLLDNIVLVAPPPEPRTRQELADIAEKAGKNCNFDIIMDFSNHEEKKAGLSGWHRLNFAAQNLHQSRVQLQQYLIRLFPMR